MVTTMVTNMVTNMVTTMVTIMVTNMVTNMVTKLLYNYYFLPPPPQFARAFNCLQKPDYQLWNI